jgi:LysM repeat protein
MKKMNLKFILSIANLLLIIGLSYSDPCDSIGVIWKDGKKYIQYRVDKGNTLYSISKEYEVSAEEIKKLNQLETLKENEVILIPFKSAVKTTSENNTHTVLAGETLYSIAQKTGVEVVLLKKINNLSSDELKVGQILILSETKVKTLAGMQKTHTVLDGETMFSIAKKYGVEVSELKTKNGLTSDVLEVNQQLIIPLKNNFNQKVEQKTVSKHKSKTKKIKGAKIIKSSDSRLDADLCELISPFGVEGEIIKLTYKGKSVYARIIFISTESNLFATELVYKKLGIETFSSEIDIEFCE